MIELIFWIIILGNSMLLTQITLISGIDYNIAIRNRLIDILNTYICIMRVNRKPYKLFILGALAVVIIALHCSCSTTKHTHKDCQSNKTTNHRN